MSRMLKTSLVALSILAGASAGYAADRNGGTEGSSRSDGYENVTPGMPDRQEMVDPNSTGSIDRCDSQSFDEFGNCIVTPDMQ